MNRRSTIRRLVCFPLAVCFCGGLAHQGRAYAQVNDGYHVNAEMAGVPLSLPIFRGVSISTPEASLHFSGGAAAVRKFQLDLQREIEAHPGDLPIIAYGFQPSDLCEAFDNKGCRYLETAPVTLARFDFYMPAAGLKLTHLTDLQRNCDLKVTWVAPDFVLAQERSSQILPQGPIGDFFLLIEGAVLTRVIIGHVSKSETAIELEPVMEKAAEIAACAIAVSPKK